MLNGLQQIYNTGSANLNVSSGSENVAIISSLQTNTIDNARFIENDQLNDLYQDEGIVSSGLNDTLLDTDIESNIKESLIDMDLDEQNQQVVYDYHYHESSTYHTESISSQNSNDFSGSRFSSQDFSWQSTYDEENTSSYQINNDTQENIEINHNENLPDHDLPHPPAMIEHSSALAKHHIPNHHEPMQGPKAEIMHPHQLEQHNTPLEHHHSPPHKVHQHELKHQHVENHPEPIPKPIGEDAPAMINDRGYEVSQPITGLALNGDSVTLTLSGDDDYHYFVINNNNAAPFWLEDQSNTTITSSDFATSYSFGHGESQSLYIIDRKDGSGDSELTLNNTVGNVVDYHLYSVSTTDGSNNASDPYLDLYATPFTQQFVGINGVNTMDSTTNIADMLSTGPTVNLGIMNNAEKALAGQSDTSIAQNTGAYFNTPLDTQYLTISIDGS